MDKKKLKTQIKRFSYSNVGFLYYILFQQNVSVGLEYNTRTQLNGSVGLKNKLTIQENFSFEQ